jgi:hypothetical protein
MCVCMCVFVCVCECGWVGVCVYACVWRGYLLLCIAESEGCCSGLSMSWPIVRLTLFRHFMHALKSVFCACSFASRLLIASSPIARRPSVELKVPPSLRGGRRG